MGLLSHLKIMMFLGISCRYSDLGDSQNSERLLVDEWDKVFDSTLTCHESKSAAEILDPLYFPRFIRTSSSKSTSQFEISSRKEQKRGSRISLTKQWIGLKFMHNDL